MFLHDYLESVLHSVDLDWLNVCSYKFFGYSVGFGLGPIIISLGCLLLTVYLLDINLFIRGTLYFFLAKLPGNKIGFLDSLEMKGIVWSTDADINFIHMNNVRVSREYDFANYYFWLRSGLLDDWMTEYYTLKKNYFVVASKVTRYRKAVPMLATYKIVTRAVYWSEKVLYMEQSLVTLKDGITRSCGYSKVVFGFDVDEFVRKKYPNVVKPELPLDLSIWIKFEEANRQEFRQARSLQNGNKNGITKND